MPFVYLHDGENEPGVLPQAVARRIRAVLVVLVDGQQGHKKDHRHADVVELGIVGDLLRRGYRDRERRREKGEGGEGKNGGTKETLRQNQKQKGGDRTK